MQTLCGHVALFVVMSVVISIAISEVISVACFCCHFCPHISGQLATEMATEMATNCHKGRAEVQYVSYHGYTTTTIQFLAAHPPRMVQVRSILVQ